mmetsp:Transcript_6033/g.17160  ORF Transcript_6033/g.17160 Transcript_6033/m.17160 type:complete len:569 (-) Transcript_6033:307-2013(-)
MGWRLAWPRNKRDRRSTAEENSQTPSMFGFNMKKKRRQVVHNGGSGNCPAPTKRRWLKASQMPQFDSSITGFVGVTDTGRLSETAGNTRSARNARNKSGRRTANTPPGVVQVGQIPCVSDDESDRLRGVRNFRIARRKEKKDRKLPTKPTTRSRVEVEVEVEVNKIDHHSVEEDEICSSSSSSSSSEESSLLSSWSDSSLEGEEQLPSLDISDEFEGIQRLEKKLAIRKERLKLLCVGRPAAYLQWVESNEEAAGKIRIASYKENHPDEVTNEDEHKDNDIGTDKRLPSAYPSEVSSTTSSSQTRLLSPLLSANQSSAYWLGLLQFEALHTLPCAYAIIVVMIGHCTFYSFMEVLGKSLYKSWFNSWISPDVYYCIFTVVGLVLMRINGHCFWYSSTNNKYSLVKMELGNRLKLGTFDARLLKRIRGSVTASACNMFGCYFVCVGINYFYYKECDRRMDSFEKWFDGIWNRATDIVNDEVTEKLQQFAIINYKFMADTSGSAETRISPTCEVAEGLLSSPFVKRLYHFWCTDYSNEYKSVELTYHGVSLLASMGLAFLIGQNVMTFCD